MHAELLPVAAPSIAVHHLAGFKGVLQVDGYADALTDAKRVDGTVVLALCWSHFRRRF